jgi:molybdenum cofactor guanylyltransferase
VPGGFFWALSRKRSLGAVAVVPRAGGRLQPLCARYEPRALGALAGSDLASSVGDVVGALGPRIVEWPDEEPFFSINGPEDILQAAALLSGR